VLLELALAGIGPGLTLTLLALIGGERCAGIAERGELKATVRGLVAELHDLAAPFVNPSFEAALALEGLVSEAVDELLAGGTLPGGPEVFTLLLSQEQQALLAVSCAAQSLVSHATRVAAGCSVDHCVAAGVAVGIHPRPLWLFEKKPDRCLFTNIGEAYPPTPHTSVVS